MGGRKRFGERETVIRGSVAGRYVIGLDRCTVL